MRKEDIKLLEDNGWDVVCESPFELEMWDKERNGASICVGEAKGYAAEIILEELKKQRTIEPGFYKFT